jgi:hypothetical protein
MTEDPAAGAQRGGVEAADFTRDSDALDNPGEDSGDEQSATDNSLDKRDSDGQNPTFDG